MVVSQYLSINTYDADDALLFQNLRHQGQRGPLSLTICVFSGIIVFLREKYCYRKLLRAGALTD